MVRVLLPTHAEPALYRVARVTFQACLHLIFPEALRTGRAGIAPFRGKGGLGNDVPRVPLLVSGEAEARAQKSELALRCLHCTSPLPLPVTEFSPRGFPYKPLVLTSFKHLFHLLCKWLFLLKREQGPWSQLLSIVLFRDKLRLQENAFPVPAPKGLSVCLPACPGHSLSVSSAGWEPLGAWKLPSLWQQDNVFCPTSLSARGGRKGPLCWASSFKDCSLTGLSEAGSGLAPAQWGWPWTTTAWSSRWSHVGRLPS